MRKTKITTSNNQLQLQQLKKITIIKQFKYNAIDQSEYWSCGGQA